MVKEETKSRIRNIGAGLGYTVGAYMGSVMLNSRHHIRCRGEKIDRGFTALENSIGEVVASNSIPTEEYLTQLQESISSAERLVNPPPSYWNATLIKGKSEKMFDEILENVNELSLLHSSDNLTYQRTVKPALIEVRNDLREVRIFEKQDDDYFYNGYWYIGIALLVICGCGAIKRFYKALFKPSIIKNDKK